MIIDFHTHCFTEKIAERAISTLSANSGGLIPQTDGTAGGLIEHMDKSGVDISCVMNIATNPKQMKAVNDFAASINGGRIVAFGSVHPDAEDWDEELDRIKALGLSGVKLHPDYQGFFADEERMKPIYRKISELGLTVLFHAGFDYGFAPPYHNLPDNMIGALKWLDTNVIAAHWGGVDVGLEVLEKLCGLPLYFDTSMGYGSVAPAIQKMLLEKHGANRFVFGSDCPWHSPAWEIRNLKTLGLSDEELDLIFYKNAKEILGSIEGE